MKEQSNERSFWASGDPRLWQLAFLGTLLLIGVWMRDFTLDLSQVLLCLGTAIGVQAWLGKGRHLFSGAITGLGLCLLVRADNLWVHPLCAALALGAKFLIRWNDKALFNPANFGVLAAMAVLPGAWTSPGQWGHSWVLGIGILALGMAVAGRAGRLDGSMAFMASWLALCAGRVGWLGQPPDVLQHQLASGSLVLFTFFMISDPRTTPDHPRGRMLHAAAVALVAFIWQFGFYRPHGPIVALALCVPLVPLLDAWLQAPRFTWPGEQRLLVQGDPRDVPDLRPA